MGLLDKIRKKEEEDVIAVSELLSSYKLPDIKGAREEYRLNGIKVAITDKYNVLEPPRPDNLEDIVSKVMLRFMNLMEGDEEERLLRAFLDYASETNMAPEEIAAAWYHVRNTCLRAGRITPLLMDPHVEDISCSGSGRPVYIYHSKYGYLPTNLVFTPGELEGFIHSVAQKAGFTLSYDNPIVDTTLYDGSRINITISVSKEPSFSIRKVKVQPFTPVFLVNNGTMSPEMAALLWLAVENRCSVMFIGGTAAGKTTAMNAAAFFIPPNSKIVSIEDTYEIMLPHDNWTPLITKGDITQLDLVKVALRQRPEYVIVGEARGLEVREMFSAMGIGHTVLTTFHGATPRTVFRRLSGEPFLIKKDQLTLLDFVVTMGVVDNKRRCVGIDLIGTGGERRRSERLVADIYSARIAGYEDGEFYTEDLTWTFARMGEKSFKSAAAIEESFYEKLKILEQLPDDPKRFFVMFGEYCKKKSVVIA